MTRTQLINQFIRTRGGRSYLEIGCLDRAAHFDKVVCQYKIGVGAVPGIAFQGDANEYFEHHHETFDVIFIDGDHTEAQVTKDIHNALRRLVPGGVIVLHDCLPPNAWHQRPREAVKRGEAWNGTVWKAALRYFNASTWRCSVVDSDWGLGIIDTAEKQDPLQLQLPAELDYAAHFSLLLSYRCAPAAYLRREVALFYHLACMGNWKDVFHEQLQQLREAGFRWMQLTALGTPPDVDYALSLAERHGIAVRLLYSDPDLTKFERPAMTAIQEYASQQEGYVLYLHSKGVSAPGDETKAKWRRLMMRELVTNADSCIAKLQEYDAIGVNWREMPPISHFCGNFWYAATSYLRKLPDFREYYENPRYRVPDGINARRLGCEFWIGSARDRPRILSLAYRNEDFCNPGFWRNKQVGPLHSEQPGNK